MQKDVREIMADIECVKSLQRIIATGGSLDSMSREIEAILDEYLDILLNAKVRI